MFHHEHRKHRIRLDSYAVLAPIPEFVDLLLQACPIHAQEYASIRKLAQSYPSDPRMIEMVRRAGDASAKVPYLLDEGETPESILETLRAVAAPHLQAIAVLPEPLQATIQILLSINMVPRGYESYTIPALLVIDQIQHEMITTLRGMMAGRPLALAFHDENRLALDVLDREWPEMRRDLMPRPFSLALPEQAQMEFYPSYDREQLIGLREVCVVIESPAAAELRRLTPRILHNPLPVDEPPPPIGSVDWLLRTVGKVGRHFTRALLQIIGEYVRSEALHHSWEDYHRINREAQESLRLFVERNP